MAYSIDLSGRVAFVTGASSGLGAQFAQTLARAGAAVVLASRRVDRLKDLRARIEGEGGDAHVVELDVTDIGSIQSAVAHAETEVGAIDILVNNSGYYSISDYTDVNPEYGTRADAKAFIAAAHRHGIKVLLDWVPNHTAFDHKWITAHPDWYAHRKDGSISYAHDNEDRETDWTDVAELNYGNTAMRRAMIADMTWWLKEMKIDGFRCDVAGGVPLDFWVQARRDLSRVRPDLFMLAEAEGPQYHRSFDMTYGWELHHMLNEISKGKMSTSVIDAYLARQDSTYPRDAYRMYFTSNHDENSWNGTEFERMGANHLPSFILAATLTNSMPLLYTGQEASFNRRLRFFEKDTVTWTGPSLAPFYHAVFDLRHREHALWNGSAGGAETRLQTDGGDKVYAFTRTRGSNTVLVAVNFGDGAASVSYSGLAVPGRYTDWFSHDRAALAASGRLELPAHGYRVLVR